MFPPWQAKSIVDARAPIGNSIGESTAPIAFLMATNRSSIGLVAAAALAVLRVETSPALADAADSVAAIAANDDEFATALISGAATV
jgi:hypothetical protein